MRSEASEFNICNSNPYGLGSLGNLAQKLSSLQGVTMNFHFSFRTGCDSFNLFGGFGGLFSIVQLKAVVRQADRTLLFSATCRAFQDHAHS